MVKEISFKIFGYNKIFLLKLFVGSLVDLTELGQTQIGWMKMLYISFNSPYVSLKELQ